MIKFFQQQLDQIMTFYSVLFLKEYNSWKWTKYETCALVSYFIFFTVIVTTTRTIICI